MLENLGQLHIEEPKRNWFRSLWMVFQAFRDLPGPTGLSPHCFFFLQDGAFPTLPCMNQCKVARDAMISEADATAAKLCRSLHDEHETRVKYSKEGKIHKYSLKHTVWVERHHKDVLTRHRQHSWYIPGVIVRKIGQDVYAVQVGDNKILDRDHTLLLPGAPDPSGGEVTLEFTAGDLDSGDDGEEENYTAERVLTHKPDPTTLGGGYTRSVGKDLPLCETRGSLPGVLSGGIPRRGPTT